MTYLDIHCLQSVPYANLNRDDTGSPKSAIFGGVPRIRVSSQAWKRPTRKALGAALEHDDTVSLSRRHVEHLAEILTAQGQSPESSAHLARVALKDGSKGFPKESTSADSDREGNDSSRVLMFMTESQYQDLATYALANLEALSQATADKADDKAFKAHRAAMEAIIAEPRGLVRLFGRMLAHLPSANTDSAIQVAHALTVHEAIPEPDYLTAVEDMPLQGEGQGAGGIFAADFASGTFYRYASINLNTLEANGMTHAEAVELACAAASAFVTALPSGKQTSTAAQVRPDVVVLQVRSNPVNLVNAFEKPVPSSSDGYLGKSAGLLAEHADRLASSFDEPALASALVSTLSDSSALTQSFGEPTSLQRALDSVRGSL